MESGLRSLHRQMWAVVREMEKGGRDSMGQKGQRRGVVKTPYSEEGWVLGRYQKEEFGNSD